MFTLRPYQEEVKSAIYGHLRSRDDNPCAVVPTAGGKTPIMASICKDAVVEWNGRVLILAHVKELLEQTADKLRTHCPDVNFGIYSAGLRRRDTTEPVIVAGIQSVYKRACELGAFDLVIVDEAHLIPLKGDGMYRQFLADARVVNPNLRIIGMTATPFRLETGPICTPDGFLNHICYEVGVRELIRDGFLSPLLTRAGETKVDTNILHVRGGEFVAAEVEELMDQDLTVRAACAEIAYHSSGRNSTLIFASGVKHGRHIVDILNREHRINCGFVCGDTPSKDRKKILSKFRTGDLQYLCNVNVLTTGFDAPQIDCVALMRPTASTGLYYQMVGRGFRLHPNKDDCLVLDFGGNVLRHGPVDELQIETIERSNGKAKAKECPCCGALVANGFAKCPQCHFEFPPRQSKGHDATASAAQILSREVSTQEYDVRDVDYRVHTKRGATDDDPKTLRVEYLLGLDHYQSEWVCFEHSGYARAKAVAWWGRRSSKPTPKSAEEALAIIKASGLAYPKSITVRSVTGERFATIISYELDPIPQSVPVNDLCGSRADEVSF